MKLITTILLSGITALAFTACGGGGGGSSSGANTKSCSTTLKYIKQTHGTGKYTV